MVRTGARATALASLLVEAGHIPDSSKRRAPRIDDLGPGIRKEILALYRDLGGTQEAPKLRPGAWDLSFDDVTIELDEELHFNRYRLLTLETGLSATAPWASAYRDACRRYESICTRAGQWGARWTTRSAENMFGGSAQPGDLDDPCGAPRWKQRAMYDAMKDAVAVAASDYRLARLSVWDDVAGVRLGELLEGRAAVDLAALSQLFASRTAPAG